MTEDLVVFKENIKFDYCKLSPQTLIIHLVTLKHMRKTSV